MVNSVPGRSASPELENDIRVTIFAFWKEQQRKDTETRKTYSYCLLIIFIIQLIIMYNIIFLVGLGVIVLTDTQFSAFFISVFGEIAVLLLTVAKYLFSENRFINPFDILKDYDGDDKPTENQAP